MKSPVPQKHPAYAAAHTFRNTATAVADIAANLVAEFALLQQAAIDLQAAAPSRDDLDHLYATDRALNGLLATEFQRLGAPWTQRHPNGNHTLPPMSRITAGIADAVVLRKAA